MSGDAAIWKAAAVLRICVLPYDLTSAAVARRQVEQFAREQNLDGTTEPLVIIASELTSNAVLHGAKPVVLTLRQERDEITVEVSDGDPAVNNVRTPAANQCAAGGKGLVVIASLADRWGVRRSHAGKTVWATVYGVHV